MSGFKKFYHILFRSSLLTLFLYLQCTSLFAQKGEYRVTCNFKNVPLRVIFQKFTEQTGLMARGSDGQLDLEQYGSLTVTNMPLEQALKRLLGDKGVTWSIKGRFIVIKKMGNITSPPADFKRKSIPIIITAKLTNVHGDRIVGALVTIKGGSQSVLSDTNGVFRITVPNPMKASLLIHHLAYEDEELPVKGKISVIPMTYKGDTLREVIAYGSKAERMYTGSTGYVKQEYIVKQPVSNPLLAMEGIIPGLFITQNSGMPGGGINVQIRGQNSLRNSSSEMGNSPFYVIDGVPYFASPLNIKGIAPNLIAAETPNVGMSPLDYINPADIASISVLKDADATAIYGSRAANGVILITTRKAREGAMRIKATISGGAGKITRKMNLLSTHQYLQMREEAIRNDGTTAQPNEYDINGGWTRNRYTNWQKELIGGTAIINDQQLSVAGGSAKVQYSLSGSRHKETTVFPGDNFSKRYTAHLDVNTVSANEKFKSGIAVNYANGETHLLGQDLTQLAVTLAPNAPALYDSTGKLNWENNTFINPLLYTKRPYRNKVNNLIVNAQLSYEILRGLSLKTSVGLVHSTIVENSKRYKSSFNPQAEAAMPLSATYGDTKANSRIIEPQLEYQRLLGKGKLNALLGTTFQTETIDQLKQTASGFGAESDMDDISKANQTTITPDPQYSPYKYAAMFGRIGYDWDYKYLISLSGRKDASSRFSRDNQVAAFGAIGAAWIFSHEDFIRNNLPFLNYGKLRASYGTTGSDQIPNYGYQDGYTGTDVPAYQGVPGIVPARPKNPDYKWEVNRKTEVALELAFLKSRISLTTAFFRNRSSNQLVGYPLAPSTGFSSIQYNLNAIVQNTGLEIEMNSHNIKSTSFNWTTSFNLSIPKNKLISFPGLSNSNYANKYAVGEPLTIVKLYKNNGVDPQTGIYNINRQDEQHINLGPVFYGGIQNDISYKSVQLSFLLQFVKQAGYNDLYNTNLPGLFNQNQPVSVLNRWQSPGDQKPIQRFSSESGSPVGVAYNSFRNSNSLVSDASYIRLKYISLSYQLPQRWKAKTNLFIRGQNLLTITKYKGLDPENRYLGLPPLKVITAGVNITL